ncbi:hypothetical protein M0802_005891 [Mischocyttarus mexicanus]|nr:hypothetical protein M0802_005891 [Mischocyttarus mexicanus]
MLMLSVGIWMSLPPQDHVNSSEEGSGTALLAIASLGVIIAMTATLACSCTARGHPALLYLYGAFLTVITLLGLGVGASFYAYRASLNEEFEQKLNDSMIAYAHDSTKRCHLDTIQSTLHCCGSKDYTDWMNLNPPKIPTSCCKVQDKCDTLNADDIYTEGCYNLVLTFISSNVGLVAGIAFGVAFFPLIGVVLACCLANINKGKYEQVA